MNKQEIYQYLDIRHIDYQVTEHPAVYNMEELSTIDLPYLQQVAKNLFVIDDKRRRYYFIVVKGERRIDLKQLRLKIQLRPLSFICEDELQKILGLVSSSVTLLGF